MPKRADSTNEQSTRFSRQRHSLPSDDLWRLHDHIQASIRFADTKAGLVLTYISGLVAALVAAGSHKVAWSFGFYDAGRVVVLIAICVAFVSCILTLSPRTPASPSGRCLFWSDIRKYRDGSEYRAALLERDAALTHELPDQLYVIAGICETKYRWISRAVVSAAASGPLAAFLIW